ncbi:MAG: hypothetical protein FJW79_12600, partial [Actinobacteria bacterium]|nr:hypothetical protein [Actinomycetota bacterium]
MARLAAILALGAALFPVPVPAAEPGEFLRLDQVLPGRCEPEVVQMFDAVDCRFPVADRAATLDPWGGPYLADVDLPYDEQNDEQAACSLEGGELVCRAVPGYYGSPGRRSVSLIFGEERSAVLATYRVVAPGAAIVAVDGREPLVFPARPLRVWADGFPAPGFAVIRQRDGGRVMATVAVPPAGPEGWRVLPVGALPSGRYRVHPCVGESRVTCEEVPGVAYFQVGTGRLLEAIPGWNVTGADRINLVLAGSGFAGFDAFAATARALLGFEGPLLLDEDGSLLPADAPVEQVTFVEWGPFAVEPLRSSRARFNLWLLTDPVADPWAMFNRTSPAGEGFLGPDGSGLPDVQVTILHTQAPGTWRESQAGYPSFTGRSRVSRDDSWAFANAYMALGFDRPLHYAGIFLHELGHALFDLRDEYSSGTRPVQHGYPNCAPDMGTARKWWGDLEGAVDPFTHEYLEVMARHGQWVPETLVADLTVGYHSGGCYSFEDEAVRPTAESLMNGLTPVLGAVNRRRTESILALWTGRAALSAPSHLSSVHCAVAADAATAHCEGSLAPYVDSPAGPLQATAGAAATACEVEPGEGADPGRVHCSPVALAGTGPWMLSLQVGEAAPLASVDLAAPPVTTTTTTSTTAASSTTAPPASGTS